MRRKNATTGMAKSASIVQNFQRSNVEQVKKAKQERDRIESALKREQERLEACKKAMVAAFNTRPYAFLVWPRHRKIIRYA